jgi:putative SOS response-associated peptidase YedK
MQDRQPFAFAGLWDNWHDPDGSQLRTCTIITTGPNAMMAALHNRMPVILDPADYQQWLDPAPRAPDSLNPMLKPFPDGEMAAHAVSTLVNSPANDRPDLVLPA